MAEKKVILTGDRPTGPLHLGHYIGSLANRVQLQDLYTQYILIADMQALTDNYDNPEKVRKNILQVALDYLAVGIDPNKSTIFIQSMIPQIAELAIIYLNLVSVNRLKRNPTVKTEIKLRGFGESVPAGFLIYPVHQAADITIVKGNLIPVGEDQLPMIEQTNEIVRTFNRLYNTDVLVEAHVMLSKAPRLPGIDGKEKMSKSAGNAIYLSDPADEVTRKVMLMYTDPHHVHVSDPGKVEDNIVFTYLDAFDPDKERVQEMKAHYERGGLGDVTIKKYLAGILNTLLEPMRQRRAEYEKEPQHVMQIIYDGTQKVRGVAQETFKEVQHAIGIDYFTKS